MEQVTQEYVAATMRRGRRDNCGVHTARVSEELLHVLTNE